MKLLKSFIVALALITAVTVTVPNHVVDANAKARTSMKKTIYVGQSFKLKIIGVKKKKVKWKSTNKKVAKVNKKGKVTGLKAGKATIVGKVGKKKFKCKLTVKARESAGQRNALARAKYYVKYYITSKPLLKEQLIKEKYSASDAQYACDRCGADWNDQSYRCAKYFLSKGALSKEQLIDLLKKVKFTDSEALFGANKAYK